MHCVVFGTNNIREATHFHDTPHCAMQRDRKEKDELTFKHTEQRQQIALRQRSELSHRDQEIAQLKQDIHQYRSMKSSESSTLKEAFRNASEKAERAPKREQGWNQDRGYEPEQ